MLGHSPITHLDTAGTVPTVLATFLEETPMRSQPALLTALVTCSLSITLALPSSAQQSQNVTLLATQNLHSSYTGSCAYVHSDGREYAVVGALQGTAIVRLTDPANPVEVAFIPGSDAGIREPEQYQ